MRTRVNVGPDLSTSADRLAESPALGVALPGGGLKGLTEIHRFLNNTGSRMAMAAYEQQRRVSSHAVRHSV